MAQFEKRESVGSVTLNVKIDTTISLFQAIKLRIAGKAYLPIAQAIADGITKKMETDDGH